MDPRSGTCDAVGRYPPGCRPPGSRDRESYITKAPAQPMTNHKNPDLASQLGDLALDTRVQLRDLTSRPELNGR